MHVVATVEGTNMKLYRNGIMTDSRSDGHEPTNLTRLKHWIGRSWYETSVVSYFEGTIAYARFWHGTALSASDISLLYANRETKNPNIFASPTVVDECDSSITGSLMNGARITPKGLELDGVWMIMWI